MSIPAESELAYPGNPAVEAEQPVVNRRPRPAPAVKKPETNKRRIGLIAIIGIGGFLGLVALVAVAWILLRSSLANQPVTSPAVVAKLDTPTWTAQPEQPTAPPATTQAHVQTEQVIIETALLQDGELNYRIQDQET